MLNKAQNTTTKMLDWHMPVIGAIHLLHAQLRHFYNSIIICIFVTLGF